MKQISRESPPTVPPRVSSNFYAMLQYSMTNKVSLTRRCCSQAESSASMTTSWAIAVGSFLEGSVVFRRRRPLRLPASNLMGTTELFSTRRHSLYIIACVFSSLFPSALFHVRFALIRSNRSSFPPEHLPPVATPSQDTFTVSVNLQSAKNMWLVSCCEPV